MVRHGGGCVALRWALVVSLGGEGLGLILLA